MFGDKDLLWYPVLSAIIGFVEFLAIFGSFVIALLPSAAAGAANSAAINAGYIIALVVYYFAVTFTST